MSVEAIAAFAERVLTARGMAVDQAAAVASFIAAAERDDCASHGIYRLLGMLRTIEGGKVGLGGRPEVTEPRPGIIAIDAQRGFSPLAYAVGRPLLEARARENGLAALVVRNCYHFSALWAEVEPLAEAGLAAIAMTPSHRWVAPAGGRKPVFGTNPIAFGWPRHGHPPYVFDFATSAVARGEIELYRRAGKQVPLGWGVDADGEPTTDPAAILAGAMNAFGGHKGSALATMVELLGAALIGDLTSMESLALDDRAGGAPLHGEVIIALDPGGFAGPVGPDHLSRAETVFDAITGQGLRLPSDRRYAARQRTLREGVKVPRALLDEIIAARDKPSAPLRHPAGPTPGGVSQDTRPNDEIG
jgi:LDH2 family malate/lactate/ureidoglycolate dehydrogenase